MVILLRAAAYLAIVGGYRLTGALNSSQAGKAALLGFLAVACVASWTTATDAETRRGRVLNWLVPLPFFFILGFEAFLRNLFGVAHDSRLVAEAIFNTDGSEAGEFFLHNGASIASHVAVVVAVFMAYGLIILFTSRQQDKGFVRSASASQRRLALGLGVVFLALHVNSTMRKADPLLYFPIRYLDWKNDVAKLKALQTKVERATAGALSTVRCSDNGPRTVVFMLGESVTRLNWSMYGYSRSTTPQLESIRNELTIFSDVVTCDGSTVLAIEKMMTGATIGEPDLWKEKPDVLTIARKTGYKTFWITNHSTDISGPIGVFASHADSMVVANRGSSRSEGHHDEVVLPHLEQALRDPAPRKFIVVHLLGGHPAYRFRYPQSYSKFDATEDSVVQGLKMQGRSATAIKMRNQYDNVMLYTDQLLRASIELCRKTTQQPVAWLFSPDHGQDVAHYTDYAGHNDRVPAMFEIPFLFWRSKNFPVKPQNVQGLAARPYQLDALDHTLLGLMQIEGELYDPRFDIFSPSYAPKPRVVARAAYH